MPNTTDLAGLKRLLHEGAQLLDVLPADDYTEEHLPSAISIP